jgi:small-conductance mechanosensitive channel
MNEFLNYVIIQLGDFTLKVSSILLLILFWTLVVLTLRIIRRMLNRTTSINESKRYAIFSLIRYFIYILSFIIILQILGFNLSVLLAGSAALLVGLGLGLQNLFSDFISGIILLVDSSIKVNDVLDVDGLVCKVQEINLRTTTVLTRDDKYIILPNTNLTKNQLINWTHSQISSRFEVHVGVDYGSDVNLVMRVLKEAVTNQEGVLKTPEPSIRFADFADSSLNFTVLFWSEEVFRVENIKSGIRVRIFELFIANNITIPFPQRVVHINQIQ